ncbi:MAG: ATPase P [Gemmatimonadetes bacterium]|nr:ATPase P [Gemmatimonadota bacterium]
MIRLEIPGLGVREIETVITDYTGTHAFAGAVRPGVKARLAALARQAEVQVLTADTFGTARGELAGLPVAVHVLTGERHDEQKRAYVLERNPQHVAAFGNGNNDRLLLKAVRDAGGLAVAVDNGEGCALDAILAADLLVHGSENALDLLLDTDRCKATLRF